MMHQSCVLDGYCCCLLVGWIIIVVGWILLYSNDLLSVSKKQDPVGRVYFMRKKIRGDRRTGGLFLG